MLIDKFGNWELPFVGSMLLMASTRSRVVLAFRMHRRNEQVRPARTRVCSSRRAQARQAVALKDLLQSV
jgi:hypothetical protein